MSRFFCKEQDMKDLTFRQLQDYLLEHYQQSRTEEGLFIKLVEEVGEVAEVLNGRSGRKEGVQDSNEELAKELADIIHYTVAIAAINNIDLTKTIFEKDKKSSYQVSACTRFGRIFRKKSSIVAVFSNLRKSL